MLSKFFRHTLSLLFLLCALLPVPGIGQVSISANQTALVLAQKLAGPGVTVLNATLTCPGAANGLFKASSTPLGIDSGITLTTGRAATQGAFYGINGNESLLASSNNQTAGDPQLNVLANSTTKDLCRLEFDLVPKGDSVRFYYVFGSEEYNNATCGPYNDAFAFFISGPGISGQDNMALVPGTSIPVTVNTINDGIPGPEGNLSNCTSMGAGSPFTAYYNDNTGGTQLTYKGFTEVLEAVHAVQPCSTYHLKLSIADGGNALYDSGVFLKAGSLSTTSYAVEAEGAGTGTIQPSVYRGCAPGRFVISSSQRRPQAQTVKFIIGGTAVNGTDYVQIADSVVIAANDSVAYVGISPLVTAAGGTGTVKIFVLAPYACNGPEIMDAAVIEILDGISAHILSQDTNICEGASFPILVQGDAGYTYSWSPAAGLNNNGVQQPLATPAINTSYVMTASLPGSGCTPVKDTLNVRVQDRPDVSAGADQALCEGADLFLSGTVSPAANYVYHWSGPGAFSSGSTSAVRSSVLSSAGGYYVFHVEGDGNCQSNSDSVLVSVEPRPAVPSLISPFDICVNGTIPVNPGGSESLLWYTQATGGSGTAQMPLNSAATEGNFIFYVSQVRNGCEGPRREQVVRVEQCCENKIFIPNAFSPNNDGRNDRWTLHKGPDDVILQVLVLNRWGQVVYEARSEADWDGNFRGQPLDGGTYYYQVLINCNKGVTMERKGDLLLMR